jgi:hypothetical protein
MLAVDHQSELDEILRRAESDEPDEYGRGYWVAELILRKVWGGKLDDQDAEVASWMVVDDKIGDSDVLLKADELFHVSAATLARRVRSREVRVLNELTGEIMIEMWLDFAAEPFRATRETSFATGVFASDRRPRRRAKPR